MANKKWQEMNNMLCDMVAQEHVARLGSLYISLSEYRVQNDSPV